MMAFSIRLLVNTCHLKMDAHGRRDRTKALEYLKKTK